MKQIAVGGRKYELLPFSGKVLQADKNLETRVFGGGGYTSGAAGSTSSVSVSSQTTVHDQLFLVSEDGKEMAFQLAGFDVACRQGHRVSVWRARKAGEGEGYNVAVQNHTTDTHLSDRVAIEFLVRPGRGAYFAAWWAGFLGQLVLAVGIILGASGQPGEWAPGALWGGFYIMCLMVFYPMLAPFLKARVVRRRSDEFTAALKREIFQPLATPATNP